jgi:hypothetical protein
MEMFKKCDYYLKILYIIIFYNITAVIKVID